MVPKATIPNARPFAPRRAPYGPSAALMHDRPVPGQNCIYHRRCLHVIIPAPDSPPQAPHTAVPLSRLLLYMFENIAWVEPRAEPARQFAE